MVDIALSWWIQIKYKVPSIGRDQGRQIPVLALFSSSHEVMVYLFTLNSVFWSKLYLVR